MTAASQPNPTIVQVHTITSSPNQRFFSESVYDRDPAVGAAIKNPPVGHFLPLAGGRVENLCCLS